MAETPTGAIGTGTRVKAAGLGIVFAALATTLILGFSGKQACSNGAWSNLKQYRYLCYSDIVPLYGTEPIQDDHSPYLSSCPGDFTCNEYPVITMYAMKLAAMVSDSYSGFFYANVVLLMLAAAVTAFALYRIAGLRALYFALAPTLLIYGFMNWDLIAVALAAAGTLAFVRRRDGVAGVLLGFGAAAKFFPALLLIPFAAERLRTKEPRRAGSLVLWSAWAWALANAPFIVLARHNWATFFRFNSERGADWDSLWFIACNRLHGRACISTNWINRYSILAFVVLSAGVWLWKVKRHPGTPRWQLGFPILVAFLLSNKVYSPQYGLWLLPWFALSLPSLPWFVAFEISDVAVFVTRFAFFGYMGGDSNGWTGAFSIGFFQIAVLVRAAILFGCLFAFVRRAPPEFQEPEAVAVAQPEVSTA